MHEIVGYAVEPFIKKPTSLSVYVVDIGRKMFSEKDRTVESYIPHPEILPHLSVEEGGKMQGWAEDIKKKKKNTSRFWITYILKLYSDSEIHSKNLLI